MTFKNCALAALLLLCTFLKALCWGSDDPQLSVLSIKTPVIRKESLALIGYVANPGAFSHLRYVNPNAPKGGTLKLAQPGTFDSLNSYAVKGQPAAMLFMTHDRLMLRAKDEPYTFYPQIAQSIEYAEDFSRVAFSLNKNAHFSDGHPITAGDFVFTLDRLKNDSQPFLKHVYKVVDSVHADNPYRVVFNVSPQYRNIKVLATLALTPALPEHFWKNKSFSRDTMLIPPSSGAMKIVKAVPGKSVTFERVKGYWGEQLPVSIGRHNFDRIQLDYYRNNYAAQEAFFAGQYDLRIESDAKAWHQLYRQKQHSDSGYIKKVIELNYPHGMSGLVFNTRRPFFKDRRVRLALNYLFDFEWVNRYLLHGDFQRSSSYFVNTALEAKKLPEGRELALLNQYRQQLPEAVFLAPPPSVHSDGTGYDRRHLKSALSLFREAGWSFNGRQMVNKASGKPMVFDLITKDPEMERVLVPFRTHLAKLGIRMNVLTISASQYQKRAAAFDFDMIDAQFRYSHFPGFELSLHWHSESAEYPNGQNLAGVKDPVIDRILEQLKEVSCYDDIAVIGRALDRILLYQHYLIPKWYKNTLYVAYKPYLAYPENHRLNWFSPSEWWHKGHEVAQGDLFERE